MRQPAETYTLKTTLPLTLKDIEAWSELYEETLESAFMVQHHVAQWVKGESPTKPRCSPRLLIMLTESFIDRIRDLRRTANLMKTAAHKKLVEEAKALPFVLEDAKGHNYTNALTAIERVTDAIALADWDKILQEMLKWLVGFRQLATMKTAVAGTMPDLPAELIAQIKTDLEDYPYDERFARDVRIYFIKTKAALKKVFGHPPSAPIPGGQVANTQHLPNSKPKLKDIHANLLQALIAMKATNRADCRAAKEIAAKLNGTPFKAQNYKRPLAKLVYWGYAASEQGQDGGTWITKSGEAALELYKRTLE